MCQGKPAGRERYLLAGPGPHPELQVPCWSVRRKSSGISLLFIASLPPSGPASPGQPGPPARFTHPFEALTGSQRSWPSSQGPGPVPGPWQPLPA
ncbi:unnamed protein product [Rangifer tarandus platyrhynchus]|uniref:Uncharacterized protein n=2 Tax=Rangifer tarandus platyrhynchus TaxID=3082113 RepID=A0ACB0DX50_RANTA|nr:unnamed protein product [Rangifer tarandus platyrhynchus]CAI9692748.1 unnamed protein product [Rangifer tarandus platyrhynchus]